MGLCAQVHRSNTREGPIWARRQTGGKGSGGGQWDFSSIFSVKPNTTVKKMVPQGFYVSFI